MAATNSKVVQIQNLNGETNQYVKVSARIPDFLGIRNIWLIAYVRKTFIFIFSTEKMVGGGLLS